MGLEGHRGLGVGRKLSNEEYSYPSNIPFVVELAFQRGNLSEAAAKTPQKTSHGARTLSRIDTLAQVKRAHLQLPYKSQGPRFHVGQSKARSTFKRLRFPKLKLLSGSAIRGDMPASSLQVTVPSLSPPFPFTTHDSPLVAKLRSARTGSALRKRLQRACAQLGHFTCSARSKPQRVAMSCSGRAQGRRPWKVL